MATQFEIGYLVGLLVGEGHFGGDGRRPQVTLRMHIRHEAIFRWIERTFPGGRLAALPEPEIVTARIHAPVPACRQPLNRWPTFC